MKCWMQWSENISAGDSPLEIRLCARAGVWHLGVILISGFDAANVCFQFLEASLHSHDARFPLPWITSPKHCRGYFPPCVFYLFCFYCATGFACWQIRADSCLVFTYLMFSLHVPRCVAATSRNLQMCIGVEKWTGSQFWQAATQNDDWNGRKFCTNKSRKSRSETSGM